MLDIDKYVVSGAKLKCTLGTEEAVLNVVVPKTLTIEGKYVATQTDCIPLVNIGCFGTCMTSPDEPKPCTPEGYWANVSDKVTVDGAPALTIKSNMVCTMGKGIISIVDNVENKKFKKLYKDIFGEKIGEKLGEYQCKIAKLNEKGLTENDMEKYTKLVNKYQALFNEAGGMQKVLDYNKKLLDENGLTEEDFRKYDKILERQAQKKRREEEMAKKFDAYGIDREWYSFEGDRSKLVSCDKENFVKWRFGNSKKCEEEQVFDFMLDKLLLYKKKYEFEHSATNRYFSEIRVQSEEAGYFDGCNKKGKFRFIMSSIKDDTDEELINLGYHFARYDQYMGDFVYQKTVGSATFTKLELTIEERDSDNKVNEKKITIDIPEKLRRDIIEYIRKTQRLQIEDISLYEKLEAYFNNM